MGIVFILYKYISKVFILSYYVFLNTKTACCNNRTHLNKASSIILPNFGVNSIKLL
jgi:hypothetical protein